MTDVAFVSIAGALFIALGRTVDKWVLTHKIKNSSVFFLIFSIALVLVGTIVSLAMTRVRFLPDSIAGFVIASSLFHVLGYLCFYKALSLGDVSTIVPLGTLKFIFILPMTFFFAGEFYGLATVVFVLVSFVGAFLTTWDEKTRLSRLFRPNAAFLLMLFTSIIWIVSDLFGKVALQQVDTHNFNVWRNAFALVILVAMLPSFLDRPARTQVKQNFFKILPAALVSTAFFYAGIILFFAGVAETLQITTVLTSSAYSVFGLVIGIVASRFAPRLLKEEHSRRIYAVRTFGVILILISILYMVSTHG